MIRLERFDQAFQSGYRLYFIRQGAAIIVLLCGGDKSTQRQDIQLAKALANDLGDSP